MDAQLDIFIPIAGEAKAKDQQDIMAFPCFSLSKKRRAAEIYFEDSRGSWVKIMPGPHGMATIWDLDILLYLATLIKEKAHRGEEKRYSFTVSGYDILSFCQRGTAKKDYQALRAALRRLQSTAIETNIRLKTVVDPETGDEIIHQQYHNFSWIDRWKEDQRVRRNYRTGKNQLISDGFEVHLPEWFVDGCWNEKLLLAINPRYFELTGGYERFLYRIARKFCGKQPSWKISMRGLYRRSGTTVNYRRFCHYIKSTIEDGQMPDYYFTLYEDEQGEKQLEISSQPTFTQGLPLVLASTG